MPARLTTDAFIARARSVHGDKYDYSRVAYKNGDTKVEIVCPAHGAFLQRPRCHLEGQICPKCASLEREATCLAKYGTEHPMISEENREKARRTFTERYGGPNPMCSSEVRQRMVATFMDHYGVDNPMKDRGVLARAQRTNVARYGHPSSFQNVDVRAKQRAVMLARYGVVNSMQIPEVRAKSVATWQERYGVDNPRRAPEIASKIRETCEARYGVPYVVLADSVREKARKTLLARYGVDNAWKSPIVRERIRATCLERYGVESPMQCPDVLAKGFATKRLNGTWATSVSEEALYQMLCGVFGAADVRREFVSPMYPWHCDFYVPSRDMYVELNASWTHMGHWYDGSDVDDVAELSDLMHKGVQSKYYANTVRVWAGYDVLKRVTASKNRLNYVVFWDNALKDAKLWFSEGCPDGHDYDRPYSWLDI